MEQKIIDFFNNNGFDFMDNWKDYKRNTNKFNFRKGDEDITVEIIINTDGL